MFHGLKERLSKEHIAMVPKGVEGGSTWQTSSVIELEIAKWIHQFDLNPYLPAKLKRSEFLGYLQKAQEIIRPGENL